MKKLFWLFGTILFAGGVFQVQGQYAPPAGQAGSTAIAVDSSVFVAWAQHCEIARGYMDITQPGQGVAGYGTLENALGVADNYVVSLGDGGEAVYSLTSPLYDGAGADFAVFENAFNDTFLELAFVAVSSDGLNYVTFPAISLTQDSVQTGTFGSLDATKIYNLAGKFRVFYGTPFDLAELIDSIAIDIQHITHIRITDVVGTLDAAYGSFDSQGHLINDPWPTAFESGGFDLDAVGLIHVDATSSISNITAAKSSRVFPNPFQDYVVIETKTPACYEIRSVSGKVIHAGQVTNKKQIATNKLPTGVYFIRITNNFSTTEIHKMIRR